VDNTEQLLLDFKESLERAIHGLAQEMREGFAQLHAKFDAQDAIWDRELAELEEQLKQA
jgi:hypothetical protein